MTPSPSGPDSSLVFFILALPGQLQPSDVLQYEADGARPVQYLCDTNIKVRLRSGASHVSVVLHLFDSIFTQEHNYQYREPLVKASKPVVLTRD